MVKDTSASTPSHATSFVHSGIFIVTGKDYPITKAISATLVADSVETTHSLTSTLKLAKYAIAVI